VLTYVWVIGPKINVETQLKDSANLHSLYKYYNLIASKVSKLLSVEVCVVT